MSPLKSDDLNLYVPRTAITATAQSVAATYETNKNTPYQKYYCCAVIDLFEITTPHSFQCPILLMDNMNDMYADEEPCNFNSVKNELINHIRKNRGFNYLHAVVQKKIFYNTDVIKQETKLIAFPDKELFGQLTNEVMIGDQGFSILKKMYKMIA